jgi:tetratricopeptide (TPR) repeat protein
VARVDPGSSWNAACHHLVRHIDEPFELRRNPIVSRFFAPGKPTSPHADQLALAAIHNAVLGALADYEVDALASGRSEESRRRRHIVDAHVLRHRPADEVAHELGLSRAQFYRERHSICDFIAQALNARWRPPTSFVESQLRRDVLAIARAKFFIEGCEPDRALLALEDIAKTASDPAQKVEAHCLIATVLTNRLDHEGAESAVARARRAASEHESGLSEQARELARLRADLALAMVASNDGRTDAANRLLEKTLGSIQDSRWLDDDLRELHVDASLFAAERSRDFGNNAGFRNHLATAQLVFAAIGTQDMRQKVKLLWLSGQLCDDRGASSTFNESIRMELAARDLAQKGGMVRTAVEASLYLSGIYAFGLGDYTLSLREALPTVRYALQARSRELIGLVGLPVAEIYVFNKQLHQALKLLELARRDGDCNAFIQAAMACISAEAYLGLRDYRRAIESADTAFKLFTRLKNRRYQSGALRIAALAYHGNRQDDMARQRIEAAVELLDRSGARTATALTYFASSVITGNLEHARVANALNPRAAALVGSA